MQKFVQKTAPKHVMGLVRTGLGIPENCACGTLWTVGLPFLMPWICSVDMSPMDSGIFHHAVETEIRDTSHEKQVILSGSFSLRLNLKMVHLLHGPDTKSIAAL